MSESKQLAVAEQPQQLITIEPAKYVDLVFEPFAKRLADAKTLAAAAEFDVTTTAGMAVAVKHRATFREIRVASEKARKERKAPILEIGKLLDTRQKEIEAEIKPFESRFDAAIKAEEKRKDDEKIAKAVAESARISAIRERIDFLRAFATNSVGMPANKMAAMLETLEAEPVTLERFQEFSGEAEMVKVAALTKLADMLAAQQAHEAEQARIADERAQLERERAEAAERERIAAQVRAEQEAKDRAERERIAAEQRAAQEAAAAAMRREQAEHEARMAAQQAELDRQQAEIAAARAEQERIERERQAAIEAEERAKREAAEAESARIAQEEADRIFAEQEAQRIASEAAEAERQRRQRVEFEKNGPDADEMVAVLADHYEVSPDVTRAWLGRHMWAQMEKAA